MRPINIQGLLVALNVHVVHLFSSINIYIYTDTETILLKVFCQLLDPPLSICTGRLGITA